MMGTCCVKPWKPAAKLEDYSVEYESELMVPLISNSEFLMHDSVIAAQFMNEQNYSGTLTFTENDDN